MEDIRVLIVDDEHEAGEILRLRLNRRHMRAEYADGGKKALEYLAQRPVDVVLLDVKMPDMDGIDTLRAIRRDFPDVAVIMLSGHADMEVAASGLSLGAFSYLLKPADIETLCIKIQDARLQGQLEGKSG